MLDLDVLYKKILPIAYLFTMKFSDVFEVEIKLRYLVWTEALYKKNFLNQRKARAKNVQFLQVVERVILAQIELDLDNNGLKNLRIEAGTTLEFTQTPLGAEKPIKAKGFTINNWMGLQDAHVLVLLNSGYRKLQKTSDPPMTTLFESTGQAQSLPLCFLTVSGDEAVIR